MEQEGFWIQGTKARARLSNTTVRELLADGRLVGAALRFLRNTGVYKVRRALSRGLGCNFLLYITRTGLGTPKDLRVGVGAPLPFLCAVISLKHRYSTLKLAHYKPTTSNQPGSLSKQSNLNTSIKTPFLLWRVDSLGLLVATAV